MDGTIFLDLLSNIPDHEAIGSLISEAAYIIIAAGGFIFVLAFFGCCGAWKKNKCLLIIVSNIALTLLGSMFLRHRTPSNIIFPATNVLINTPYYALSHGKHFCVAILL